MAQGTFYIVPGLGQLRAGQWAKGLFLLAAFAGGIVLGGVLMRQAISLRELGVGALAVAFSVLIWVYNMADLLEFKRMSKRAEEEQTQAAPRQVSRSGRASGRRSAVSDELYSKGRIAYLRGSMDDARECFEKILKKDKADLDAAFQLGRVFRDMGDRRQADRYFRQCKQSPGGGKWSEEINRYFREAQTIAKS